MSKTKHVVLLGRCFADMGSIPIASTKIKDFMKNTGYIFSIFFVSLCHFLSAEFNIHSTLILNHKPAVWSYAGYIIRKNPHYSFDDCKKKWQKKLDSTWKKIAAEIAREFEITEDAFSNLLFQEELQNIYKSRLQNKPETPQNKNNAVIKFIIANLSKYTFAQCSVSLDSETTYSTLVEGFGLHHSVRCNSHIFNPESMHYVLKDYREKNVYIVADRRLDNIAYVDINVFIPMLIAFTASQINHNANFYTNVVHFFSFRKKTISTNTREKFDQFSHYINALEAVFQSENPLEVAAYFYAMVPLESRFEDKELAFWQSVIADLERCYHPEDLEAYRNHIGAKKNPYGKTFSAE